MKIYKYQLWSGIGTTNIEMPKGAKILSFQYQQKTICAVTKQGFGILYIWCLIDETQPKEIREFVMVGTGFEFDSSKLTYIGTVQEEQYVWHLFENKHNENKNEVQECQN